jgi:hypothetical protein
VDFLFLGFVELNVLLKVALHILKIKLNLRNEHSTVMFLLYSVIFIAVSPIPSHFEHVVSFFFDENILLQLICTYK